jgi:hypothetical protein
MKDHAMDTMHRTWMRWRGALALAASALLLAGCVTGGYPGGYGQPSTGYPAEYGGAMVGTVQSLDRGYDRIVIVLEDRSRHGRGQQVALRYDGRTRLYYQGREHPVEGLERGDVIRVEASRSGRDWWARSIEVLRNVREQGHRGDGYTSELRGTVAYVDQRARVLRLDGGGYGGASSHIAYDGRTTVEYRGRNYRPENLQRGDLVRVQARRVGGGQWLAERVFVERSVGAYGY